MGRCEGVFDVKSLLLFIFYSHKIISNNAYVLLNLSKVTKQHHRDNTEGSEKTTTTPRPKNPTGGFMGLKFSKQGFIFGRFFLNVDGFG